MRALAVVLAVSCALAPGAGCRRGTPARHLDLDAIRVTSDARLRTDTVGDGRFASVATFVLVDAENLAGDGAYVTLGGELTDPAGATLGQLGSQSLWIPGGERRTFALVDTERVPRPASASARIKVFGALIPDSPPAARITDLHVFDDHGKSVVQANLVNDATRLGTIMVIAAFHGPDGRPMTRPFQMVPIDAGQTRPVQFVGPAGSTRGTMFVGDVVY